MVNLRGTLDTYTATMAQEGKAPFTLTAAYSDKGVLQYAGEWLLPLPWHQMPS